MTTATLLQLTNRQESPIQLYLKREVSQVSCYGCCLHNCHCNPEVKDESLCKRAHVPRAGNKEGLSMLLPQKEQCAKSAALNLYFINPLSGFEQPFPRGHLRTSGNTDIYITMYNSSKLMVMK